MNSLAPAPALPRRLLGALLLVAASALPLKAQTTVFSDNFDNGVVADSDSATGFWKVNTSNGSAPAEADGRLHLSTANTAKQQSPSLTTQSVSPDFNFFTRPLTFAVGGLSYSSSNPASSSGVYLQLEITSAVNTSASAVPDAFGVRIRADNTILIGMKEDNNSSSLFTGGNVIETVAAGSAITGFSFTLSAAGWSFVATLASGPDVSLSGLFPEAFTQANWDGVVTTGTGSGTGNSAIVLQLQNNSGGTVASDFSLDSFTVTTAAIPEPAACAALLGLAALLGVSLRRRR